ncbi:sulfurtransferase TusA family protein [Niallia taxi]|uniref:sulfurtransferase TusA family protein n=1 Tax=Niallia taxi TaxID=2499688 RepID=UPI002E1F298C|nr:sulfurtransferase TusA family protein [Niallia taxi]
MNSNKVLDAKGLACPMPIVKTKKAMVDIETGEVLEVHTTDKGALNDLTAWAKSGGHELIKHEDDNGVLKRVENKGDQIRFPFYKEV